MLKTDKITLDDKVINQIIHPNNSDNLNDMIGNDVDYSKFISSEVMDMSLEERGENYTKYMFLNDYIKEIKNINILEFNYDTFKDELNDFSIEEFNDFFNISLLDILDDIEDNYLYLNMEQIYLLNSKDVIRPNVLNKLNMTEIIIEFLMFKLPYTYLRKLLKNVELEDIYNTIHSDDIKTLLIDIIEEDNNSLKNLGTIINSFKDNKKMSDDDIIRKNDKLNNLNNNLNKRANINLYYTNLINATDLKNLQGLLEKYLEVDSKNII